MDKKKFKEKWKKAEHIKNSAKNNVMIVIILKNEAQIIADNYEFIYDTAKEYYENDNDCEYDWHKDAIYLENNNEYVAIVRLSDVKDIKVIENYVPTNDYFEIFDLCKAKKSRK